MSEPATPTPAAGAADDPAALKRSLIAQLAKGGVTTSPDDITVAGAYARLISDGSIAFYKLEDGAWQVLAAGSMIPPETLERLGVPQDL